MSVVAEKSNSTCSENSFKVLQELSASYAEQYPGEDIPEEFQVAETLTDEKIKFFAPYVDGFSFATIPMGVQTIVIETFANEQTWKDLVSLKDSAAKDSIEILYLGHDGIIYGEECDISETLNALPNLKEIHYCGYYSHYENALYEVAESKNILVLPIY